MGTILGGGESGDLFETSAEKGKGVETAAFRYMGEAVSFWNWVIKVHSMPNASTAGGKFSLWFGKR